MIYKKWNLAYACLRWWIFLDDHPCEKHLRMLKKTILIIWNNWQLSIWMIVGMVSIDRKWLFGKYCTKSWMFQTWIIFDIHSTFAKSFVSLEHKCTWHAFFPHQFQLARWKNPVTILFGFTKNFKLAQHCLIFELTVVFWHVRKTCLHRSICNSELKIWLNWNFQELFMLSHYLTDKILYIILFFQLKVYWTEGHS